MTKKYYDALDSILDRPIAFNPSFKKITGSTNAALLLSQAFYWTKRTSDQDGWFYKTREEWMEETGLTLEELDGARDKCKAAGVIEEKRKGVPATIHYRINKPKVYELLGFQIGEIPQSGLSGLPQIGGNPESGIYPIFNKESETTTEITPSAGVLSEEDYARAGAMVTAQIVGARKAYPYRNEIPEPYLSLCDTFVTVTTLKPNKRDLVHWIATFADWVGEGLQPDDIQAAYEYASRPDGFLVTSPSSLTKTAVALKAKKAAVPRASAPVITRFDPEKDKKTPPPAWAVEEARRRRALLRRSP